MKKNQVEGARKRSLASQMQRLLTQIVALPEYRWQILHMHMPILPEYIAYMHTFARVQVAPDLIFVTSITPLPHPPIFAQWLIWRQKVRKCDSQQSTKST